MYGGLKLMLQKLDKGQLHLVIDMWTSRRNFAVIGITAQYIKDGKMMKSVVCFKHFDDSHTAKNIQDMLEYLIKDKKELGLQPTQVRNLHITILQLIYNE
jgi:hypothetical protein